VGTCFARRSPRRTDLAMYSNQCFSPWEVLPIFSSIDFRSFPPQLDDHSRNCPAEEVRNKSDPLCDEVDLLDVNPNSALIRFQDGRETTVPTSDLAPAGRRVDSPDSYEGIDIQLPMLNSQCPWHHRLNLPKTPRRSTYRQIPLLTALFLWERPIERVDRQIIMVIRSLLDDVVTDKYWTATELVM